MQNNELERNKTFSTESEKITKLSKLMSSKGTVTVRIKKGIYDEAKKICDDEDLVIVDYINTAVAEKIINNQ